MNLLHQFHNKLNISLQMMANNVSEPKTVEIVEGSAKIVSENRVFYNPVQQFNRDLSLSVLATFWQLCQQESEKRKNGNVKVPGNDIPVSIMKKRSLLRPVFSSNQVFFFKNKFLTIGWTSCVRSSICDWFAKYSLCKRSSWYQKNYCK